MRRILVAAVGLTLVASACGSRVVPLSSGQQPGGVSVPVGGLQTIGGQTIGPSNAPGATTGPGDGGVPTGGPSTAPNCHGGATDTGVRADRIDIGLVAAKTGALPGQFQPTIDAVDAYFKMVNADFGGICGRKVVLHVRDDAGRAADNERYARELADEVKVFAFVGSVSAPDSDTGIARVSKEKKIVDIGFPLTYARSESAYTYGVPGQLQRKLVGEEASMIPYLNKTNGIKQIALFWLGEALVSKANAWAFEAAALRASGGSIKICYERETSTLDNNFGTYASGVVSSCPSSGGPLAIFTTMENSSNVKLAQALAEAQVQYKVFAPTFTSYLPQFLRDEFGKARAATKGAYMALPQIPFERCASFDSKGRPVPPCSHPELDRYVRSLHRFEPGFKAPGSFGAPGWGMAVLFTEAAAACGANLTRACLKNEIDKLGAFSAHGMVAPTIPREHKIYGADLLVRVQNGKFVEQPKGDAYGPPSAPDFWGDSKLFDWWQYFCANKAKFSNQERDEIDAFVTDC